MKYKNDITVEFIESILDYDPQSGIMIWKYRPKSMFQSLKSFMPWNKRYAGKEINCLDKDGYIQISIYKKRYFAHRVAWLLVYREWPNISLDHINGIKSDNRIHNLRMATESQNAWNTRAPSNNKSGYKGVSFHALGNKWQAHISKNNTKIYLGLFNTPEEAYGAYKKAAIQLHGEYARI